MNVLLTKSNYALIDKGHEYVVACNYNPETKEWGHGTYFSHWNNESEKVRCFFNAVECFRIRTEENYISRYRLEELATQLKDGLLETDEEYAREYFEETCCLDENEREWLGLNEEE